MQIFRDSDTALQMTGNYQGDGTGQGSACFDVPRIDAN